MTGDSRGYPLEFDRLTPEETDTQDVPEEKIRLSKVLILTALLPLFGESFH